MVADSTVPDAKTCTFGTTGVRSQGQVLLWGDSHADHFRPSLEQVAVEKSLSLRQSTKTVCPPLLAVAVINRGREAHDCATFNESVMKLALSDQDIKVVVLAARWAAYAEGRGKELDEAELFLTTREAPRSVDRAGSRRALDLGLRETVRRLISGGKAVVVIGQAPEFGRDVPKCVSREAAAGRGSESCNLPRTLADARTRSTSGIFARLRTEFSRLAVLLPVKELCNPESCPAVGRGVVMMRDSNHLTRSASLLLAPSLSRIWPVNSGRAVLKGLE